MTFSDFWRRQHGTFPFGSIAKRAVWIAIVSFGLFACSSDLQTKVSGNLNALSGEQIVAILPVEVADHSPRDAANLFRQVLHSKLKQTHFEILEPYVVDGLLRKNGLTEPAKYPTVNPMHLGEVLGADVVLISRLNKVERSYFLVHSSIKLSISVQMVDTRSGEILWRAEQTETDYQGFWKIPTGVASAVVGPFYFVTNKLSLNRITTKMVDKLTDVVKHPGRAGKDKTFAKPLIASAAARDIQRVEKAQQVRAKWAGQLFEDAESIWSRDSLAAIHGAPKPKVQPVTLTASYQPEPQYPVPGLSQTLEIPIDITPNPTEPADAVKKLPETAARAKPKREKTPRVYTVQVGAYRTRALAEKLVARLVGKGYQAFMTEPTPKKKTILYRVRVDLFPNKKGAAQLAKKLRSREHLKNFVTTLSAL